MLLINKMTTNAILTESAQYALLAVWAMYLTVPYFYIALTKWPISSGSTGDIKQRKLASKLLVTFILLPFIMALFSTNNVIFATKTNTILGLVGIYGMSWLFEGLMFPNETKKALDADADMKSLSLLHFSNIAIVFIVGAIYIRYGRNALINKSKINITPSSYNGGGYSSF